MLAAERDPHRPGQLTSTTEIDLALSLLCVGNALLHPVLDCIAFSLVTLIRRCNGQKYLDFYSCWLAHSNVFAVLHVVVALP